jgi:hypothetical protein
MNDVIKVKAGQYMVVTGDGRVYMIRRGTPGEHNQPWTVLDPKGQMVSRHTTLRDAHESL